MAEKKTRRGLTNAQKSTIIKLDKKGLTQKEIGEQVGCSRSTVGRYLRGSKKETKVVRAVRKKPSRAAKKTRREATIVWCGNEEAYAEQIGKKTVKAVRKKSPTPLALPPTRSLPIFNLAFFITVTLAALITIGIGAYLIFEGGLLNVN